MTKLQTVEENKTGKEALVAKWGNEIFDDGVSNYPQCFARYGRRFVTGGEYSFIMNVLSYQYGSDLPFPSQETIAKNMGVNVRQISKFIESLESKDLIEIYYRYNEKGKRTSNEYSFAPLLHKCLEESKKEKGAAEQGVKRVKKKKTTKCTLGTDSELNVPEVQVVTEPEVHLDPVPEVQTNKVIKESGFKKDFEEEEDITTVVTEADVINLVNAKIEKHGITNEKTLTAIFDVALKCRAIGTDNKEAAENYVIKVVEDKMSKLGQKQKVKQPKQGTGRKEQLPEWLEEQKQNEKQPTMDQSQSNTAALEEDRRKLEEELKIYQRV